MYQSINGSINGRVLVSSDPAPKGVAGLLTPYGEVTGPPLLYFLRAWTNLLKVFMSVCDVRCSRNGLSRNSRT